MTWSQTARTAVPRTCFMKRFHRRTQIVDEPTSAAARAGGRASSYVTESMIAGQFGTVDVCIGLDSLVL